MNEIIQSIETELKTINVQLQSIKNLLVIGSFEIDNFNKEDFITNYNKLSERIKEQIEIDIKEHNDDNIFNYEEYRILNNYLSLNNLKGSENGEFVYKQIEQELNKHFSRILSSSDRLKIQITNLRNIIDS